MIDWFSGLVGYDASKLIVGTTMRFDREGELIGFWDNREEVKGSHDSSVQVCVDSCTGSMLHAAECYDFVCHPQCLKVSGNPTKFLQGHNLLGPGVSYLGPVVQAMIRAFPSEFRPGGCDLDKLPAVKRSRVDITVMVDLGSHEVVHDWLAHAASQTRSRHGRALTSEGTVYWGKHSRRWALKAYCKGCELKKHPAPGFMGDDVQDWANRMLRLELVLRSPELKERGSLDESLIWEFMKRIEVGVMKDVRPSELDLPRAVSDVFKLWLAGYDVRSDKPRATFYWQRRKILDAIGVDISLTPTEEMEKLGKSGISRDLFDVEVLKSKVANEGPPTLQQSLWKTEAPPGEWPRKAEAGGRRQEPTKSKKGEKGDR